MPLEATMLIVDNSEYMRNGDYQPTRFEAQSDAINVVFQTKIDSNPENTVGIMTMAGKGPEVLVTHTKDLGQIIQGVHIAGGKIGGSIDIPTAIAVAQLALKHRENKNLRQRIIVFVASPLDGPGADEQSMVKLAKKLKKNNVAVDIVSYGDGIEEPDADGKTVLKSFVENVTSSDNSHLLTVHPGLHLLSDALISSPILSGDRSASIPEELGGTAPSAAGPSTSNNFEFGVDPSLDPELAMALRMSMQEAQAREAAEAAAASTAAATATTDSLAAAVTTVTTTAASSTTAVPADPTDAEEERLLQEALAMSKAQDDDVDMDDDEEEEEEEEEDEEDEDAAIARAIEMSMRGQEDDKAAKKK
ncbi:hypothetical protein BYT27DRAFT_7192225 [Phlegmacium glaucopus]|nr:hypothetical protein BYT27DRAFT_7192225 [Phlegmacium glaucopus]